MGQDLAIRSTIEAIEGHRAQALALFERSYDLEQEACDAVALAAPSANRLQLSEGRRYKARDKWLEERRREVDSAIWNYLIQATHLERLMDRTAREAFRRQLADNPPPATADNCAATLQQLMGDADMIFKRGIATAFAQLDRRFRSHDGFKVGSRVVESYALTTYGAWSGARDETLRDIERTFHTLDGKPHPERSGGICGLIDAAKRGSLSLKAFEVEDDYFRVRGFKNGNVHLWLKRADLVARVNQLLADYYGAALGAAPDVADRRHAPKGGLAKNYGFFPTPSHLVSRVLEAGQVGTPATWRGDYPRLSILEPSAGLGAIAQAAAAAGHLVTAVEIQPGHATHLREAGGLQRVLCEDFLALDPAGLGLFDRVLMNPPFDGGRDVDHVTHALRFLAPGGRLVAIMAAGVEFREDRKTTDFRALVERFGGTFQDLPAGSFQESGTNVNTVLLSVRAPMHPTGQSAPRP